MKINASIRLKLNLGIINQAIIIILIVAGIVYLRLKVNSITAQNELILEESKIIQHLAFDMNDYFNNKIDYETVKKHYEEFNNNVVDLNLKEDLAAIFEQIEQFNELQNNNNELINKVNAKTEQSITSLNSYIHDGLNGRIIATRPAIDLAYSGTKAFFEVNQAFSRLQRDPDGKTALLELLDNSMDKYKKGISVVPTRTGRELIQSNIEALSTIKGLTNIYANNLTSIKQKEKIAAQSTDNIIVIHNQDNIKKTNKALNNFGNVMGTALLVFILFAIFVIFLNASTSITINRFIQRMGYFIGELGKGNLVLNVSKDVLNRNDEFGQMAKILDNTIRKLQEIVDSIKSGAESISNVGLQLSSSSQSISQGASEQASSIQEVSASMEEMVSNIDQNHENASQTDQIATQSANGVKLLGESAQVNLDSVLNIASKITIVNDIAFQTNLLALNAAVEAARAGEHGRGFAVVAAEVRKLAERSKIAADEIEILSKTSVNSTEESRGQMEVIIPEIIRTSKLVQEIAAASAEQKSGAEQINNAVQQLNSITQQNASSSEELAGSAEELACQADELQQTINFFKTNGHSFSSAATKVAETGNNVAVNVSTEKQNTSADIKKEAPENLNLEVLATEKSESGVNFELGGENVSDDGFERF